MKLHAAVKAGLLWGLVAAICMHITAFVPFYESAYQFTTPRWLLTALMIVFWPVMVAATLAIGPMAVRAAGDSARGWREAALTGAGAGLVAGLVNYLTLGALASVMVLGVVPLIAPLSNPSSVAGVRVDALLRPIVQDAVIGVYRIQLSFILSGVAFGAVTGAIFAWVRPLLRRKEKAAAPAAAD